MDIAPFKTRFAPSPTGLLHLGNVRTALFNWLLARARGGVFLLRLEDSDAVRGHEKFAQALIEDLRWLGLGWQEGPEAGGAAGPYHQSQRGPIYRRYFEQLAARGLAYPCFCSEHELEIARKTAIAARRPPRYAGRCRALSAAEAEARLKAGTPATLRFRVPEGEAVVFEDAVRGRQEFATSDIGDFVIRRSDGTPAFFFCNAVDDALMQVTLVVRGEDHLTNTPRQILLLQALGLAPPSYAHIALVVGADGAPLSKRTGSRSVQELRAAGYLPSALNNYLARLGHTGASDDFLDLEALAAGFAVERLHRSPARFDEQQLNHWQHRAVQHESGETIAAWLAAAIAGLVPPPARADFIAAVRGNVHLPADARHWAQRLFSDDWSPSREAQDAARAAGAAFFRQALAALDHCGDDFKTLGEALAQASGARGPALYKPLRAALTGALDGPELARLLPLMGVERVRRRLERYANP